ncbi:MAG: hypothetical protein COA74_01660 [Gammaproteobacteria bacterium]|nr:MAG: hypothetical protein COA74_01660 [Gammaproteobacteria bacterium]
MDSSIIIIIIVLLVASVVGSIIFTKKEQAAALRRQQVSSFRYRADEAQDLYDGLQTAGLEKITYQFLLERIIGNLQEAFNIDPRSPGIKLRLNSAKMTLSELDSIQFYVQMPSAMIELQGLVGRLNKLVKYLIILFQKRAIAEHQYQLLMPAVQRTLLKFDAEGHIKMGHQAANEGHPGTAKQYYLHAKDKLLGFGSEDSYVITQLEKVEELINSLEEDNQLPGDSQQRTVPIDQVAAAIAANDEVTEEQLNAKESQEALNRKSESDDAFETKKKW